MDMSPMNMEPTLASYFLMACLVYLFPVGALVLRPLRRRTADGPRVVLTLITILGILAAPLAIVMTFTTILMAIVD